MKFRITDAIIKHDAVAKIKRSIVSASQFKQRNSMIKSMAAFKNSQQQYQKLGAKKKHNYIIEHH